MIFMVLTDVWVGVDELKGFGVRVEKDKIIYKGSSALITDTGLVFVGERAFPLNIDTSKGIKFKGDELAPVLFNMGLNVFWDVEGEKLFLGEPTIKMFLMGVVDTTYRITIKGGDDYDANVYEDSIVVNVKGLYGKYRKIIGDGRFVSVVDVSHTRTNTKFIIHLGFGAGKSSVYKGDDGITITIYPIKTLKTKGPPVVVIDPGHGGRDAGAVANGYKEKDINLAVTLELAKILKGYGYKVILTREGDEYVPLSKRARIANRSGADMFVSIHCNASMDKGADGLETYFLSESRTSEERAVALLENSAIKYDLGNLNPTDEVGIIVGDLIQTLILEQSYKLAGYIHGKAIEYKLSKDRGLKQAGFYVLKWVSMPSVLIEIGFITNKKEVEKLASKDYQKRVAKAIAEGIREFLEEEKGR